jgi:hypothetical protein
MLRYKTHYILCEGGNMEEDGFMKNYGRIMCFG